MGKKSKGFDELNALFAEAVEAVDKVQDQPAPPMPEDGVEIEIELEFEEEEEPREEPDPPPAPESLGDSQEDGEEEDGAEEQEDGEEEDGAEEQQELPGEDPGEAGSEEPGSEQLENLKGQLSEKEGVIAELEATLIKAKRSLAKRKRDRAALEEKLKVSRRDHRIEVAKLQGVLKRLKEQYERAEARAEYRAEAIQTANARIEALEKSLEKSAAQAKRERTLRQKEAEEAKQYGSGPILLKMLPTLDNLQRALSHAEADPLTIVDGVKLSMAQFVQSLVRFGVRPVDSSEGTPFDPNLHEALSQSEHESIPDNGIIEEVSTGYTLNGRLLRAAKVVVSKSRKPLEKDAGPEEPADSGTPPVTEDAGEEEETATGQADPLEDSAAEEEEVEAAGGNGSDGAASTGAVPGGEEETGIELLSGEEGEEGEGAGIELLPDEEDLDDDFPNIFLADDTESGDIPDEEDPGSEG